MRTKSAKKIRVAILAAKAHFRDKYPGIINNIQGARGSNYPLSLMEHAYLREWNNQIRRLSSASKNRNKR